MKFLRESNRMWLGYFLGAGMMEIIHAAQLRNLGHIAEGSRNLHWGVGWLVYALVGIVGVDWLTYRRRRRVEAEKALVDAHFAAIQALEPPRNIALIRLPDGTKARFDRDKAVLIDPPFGRLPEGSEEVES